MTEFSKGYLIGFLVGVVCMIICAITHDLLEDAQKKYDAITTYQEKIIKNEEEIKKLKKTITATIKIN